MADPLQELFEKYIDKKVSMLISEGFSADAAVAIIKKDLEEN